jgi:hypothetical protein
MEPAPKGGKAYDFDKPKEIARWVKSLHDKRAYFGVRVSFAWSEL